MDDLIRRQEAIDALKEHEDYKGYLRGDFEEILEALPSVQPELATDCISRQAAINTVSNWLRAVFGINSNANTGVFSELLALPSAEPVWKPDEWCVDCKEYDHEKNCCPRFNRVIKSALKDAEPEPSDVARDIATIIENEKDMRVIAEPRKGKWIHDGYDFPHGNDWIHCSICGKRGINVPANLTNFCPNCGFPMSEGVWDE